MPCKFTFHDLFYNKKIKNVHSVKNNISAANYSLLVTLLALTPLFSHAKPATLTPSSALLVPEMLSQQRDTLPGLFAADGEEQAGYGTIKNVALGSESCLTLQPDNSSVTFQRCQDTARQRWQLSQIMTGYLKITSEALAEENKEYCLGMNSSAAQTEPTMMECTGSGFNSQRSWKAAINQASAVSDIVYTLENKYRNDLGKKEVLGHSNNRLQMVATSTTNDVSWQLSVPAQVATRPVIGNKKVLLLHTHYSDRSANDLAAIKSAVFGSGTDFSSLVSAVRIASYGKLLLSGDTVSDIDLGPRPAICSSSVVAQAQTLARAKGIEPNNYDYVFVEIPSTSCSWTGLAATPGRWIIGNASGHKPWMWQHEFGHNLGAPHATSLEGCTTNSLGIVQLDQQCRKTTAGDPSDTMNGGGSRLYPAPYLLYAGWLSDAQMPQIDKPGNYTLTPLFNTPNEGELKGLRILRRDGTYLTLEYRQPGTGFEGWASSDPFVNGVIVRVASFGSTVSNTLVDTTPGSADGMKDAPLMPGKSIDDVLSGKRITLLNIDARGAHLHIGTLSDANEEVKVPVAVVPEDFSVVARNNDGTVRILNGNASTGNEFVWTTLAGSGRFGLQAEPSGPMVPEVRQSSARAAFPGGATGQARYQLTVTGSHGMTDSKIVTVTVLPPQVNINGQESLAPGEVVVFNSQDNFEAAKWHWSLVNGSQTVAESDLAVFELDSQNYASGTYQLKLDASSEDGRHFASATKTVTIAATEKAYPEYVEGTAYQAGDKVHSAGGNYSCKPLPFTPWCAGVASAYAPGVGQHWQDAWDKID